MITHPIEPVYDENSKILILGSFPSVASRKELFFYGHKQNRFWRVLSRIFECDEPRTVDEKRKFLLSNGIALWDVIASCDIVGSSDSSIKNVIPNDIEKLLRQTNIEKIFVNGKSAQKYYDKYLKERLCREAVYLPSSSPANAAYSVERLVVEWRIAIFEK